MGNRALVTFVHETLCSGVKDWNSTLLLQSISHRCLCNKDMQRGG